MEGIFCPSGTAIMLETVQYDVSGWSDSTSSYSKHLGPYPSDSNVAVNYSYFGRKKLPASSVQEAASPESDSVFISVNSNGTILDAKFYTANGLSDGHLELRDMLGRLIYSNGFNYANPGWSEMKFPASSMASGLYFCSVTGGDYSHAKSFLLIK